MLRGDAAGEDCMWGRAGRGSKLTKWRLLLLHAPVAGAVVTVVVGVGAVLWRPVPSCAARRRTACSLAAFRTDLLLSKPTDTHGPTLCVETLSVITPSHRSPAHTSHPPSAHTHTRRWRCAGVLPASVTV